MTNNYALYKFYFAVRSEKTVSYLFFPSPENNLAKGKEVEDSP